MSNHVNTAILRRGEVEALTGLARSTLYDLMKKNKFPTPVALTESGRAVGWLREEVESYLQNRITIRDHRAGVA